MSIFREQRGSVTLLVASAMVVLLGFAALVVDIGFVYWTRAQLVTEADSAALAGAGELPISSSQAEATARTYAASNGQPGDSFSSVMGNGNTSLTVQVSRTVDLLFARVFGHTTQNVTATATATVSAVGSADHVVPFGVVRQDFQFGRTVTLRVGGGDGTTGNFGALALGGNGSRNYVDNIKEGYEGTLSVGQWITTETGNMAGPTETGVDYRISQDPSATYDTAGKDSPRIIVVPVLDSLTVNGRNEVLIVGFATFFLEGATKGEVSGKFMQTFSGNTTPGNGVSYGYYNVRLTQ